ncbi:uncharacterized protein KGF55_004661 [Candida pseudojiufengensis]|uniref:uncharacterized protein n=1 Tax=Candida pseudojiufengensis TaxID=497109 RepID=UPI002224A8F8|nr:uncharacterized protein KGF55_004661 [Candida pseudojiufengensis]KAI5960369.1 hypothetical protein KGF55_004661 [Candida pseudojiufengensis]
MNEKSHPKVNYKHPSGLPTLLHLAQISIKRHITQLQDVGATPFHLLESILKLMSSKQLDHLESLSNQLMPFTDEIWNHLITKDFPDRPNDLGPLGSTSQLKYPNMPYKSLYFKYVKQRDDFRKDSAKRLRHMNKSIQKERSMNQIVTIDEIRRDPSIKRRKMDSNGNYGRTTQPVNKNTILGKAMRESQSRSLMFGKAPHKNYDPYNAFQYKDDIPIRAPRQIKRITFFDQSNKQPKSPSIKQDVKSKASPPPSSAEIAEIARKRKLQLQQNQPSIFIKRRNQTSPSPIKKKAPTSPSSSSYTSPRKDESPSKIKPMKSSIFS